MKSHPALKMKDPVRPQTTEARQIRRFEFRLHKSL